MQATDFRLYHGNALDVLAGLLAEELRAVPPGASLLEPDTILIPQPSMRRWLQATLAERHGIAANLRFLAPGEFVAEVLAANVPEHILMKNVNELELSVRSRKALQRLGINTVGELATRTEAELLGVKNFGQTSLLEIKQRLTEMGLGLRKLD